MLLAAVLEDLDVETVPFLDLHSLPLLVSLNLVKHFLMEFCPFPTYFSDLVYQRYD
jgi:hypothetical protein